MNEDEIRETLKSFECRRCNECCRQPGFVYITPVEVDAMAELLKMDPFDFTEAYCEVVDRKRLVLKKLPDESCIFLESGGCRVHAAKPVQCREFPLRWRTVRSFQYCQGLKAIFPHPPGNSEDRPAA